VAATAARVTVVSLNIPTAQSLTGYINFSTDNGDPGNKRPPNNRDVYNSYADGNRAGDTIAGPLRVLSRCGRTVCRTRVYSIVVQTTETMDEIASRYFECLDGFAVKTTASLRPSKNVRVLSKSANAVRDVAVRARSIDVADLFVR